MFRKRESPLRLLACRSTDTILFDISLIDIFTTDARACPEAAHVKKLLVEYNNLLITAKLTNDILADLPIPTDLDPSKPIPLPSRLSTLMILIKDTLAVLIGAPFFLLPMVMHLPMYYIGKVGENMAREEMETQAQTKIVFGLLLTFLVYPVWFFLLWILIGPGAFGAVVAAVAIYLFSMSHKKLIDENYDRMRRLVGTWRVLVAIWSPKTREVSLEYLKTFVPQSAAPTGATPTDDLLNWQKGVAPDKSDASKKEKQRRLPTRKLIKHALRTRVKASKALEHLLTKIERQDVRVAARPWLAEMAAFGGETDEDVDYANEHTEAKEPVKRVPMGSRAGREVVQYLREHGANIYAVEGDLDAWAGLHSEWEGVKSDDHE